LSNVTKPFNPEELASFWAKEAPIYESQNCNEGIYPMQEIRNQYILNMIGDEPRDHADIGCGPAFTIIPLLKKGWRIQGLDISEEMLKRARQNISAAGLDPAKVELVVGNIEALPYPDGRFDSVICAGVIEYLKDDDKALKELHRILKPGGVLVITVRNKLCLFRLWDALLPVRKGLRALLARMNLLGGKAYLEKSFRDGVWYKKHAPGAFDRELGRYGFEKQDHHYFHYYVLPAPLEYKFGKGIPHAAFKLERLTKNRISTFLASGYIVKAVKKV
jgi:ubiquinone/menaquinone biosynthesis C-methylase UbiE